MTEVEYLILSNQNKLSSAADVLRGITCEQTGCYGLTTDELRQVTGPLYDLLDKIRKETHIEG